MTAAATTSTGVSLRQAAVWYAEHYEVPGDHPERNENLKRLLRDRLEQWSDDGAEWIEVSGDGAGKRIRVQLDALADTLEKLPHCLGCDRPALRADGACGTCGHGRTGRPRTHEWQLQTCAGCGRTGDAPLYGRQRSWWCDECNGRQRYEPEERSCEWCGGSLGVRPGHIARRRRFCGYSCSAYARFADAAFRARWLRARARLIFTRTKSTAEFGRRAAALAAAHGNVVGRPGMKRPDGSQLNAAELERLTGLLADPAWSQGRIAILFGVSRDQVKRYAAAAKKLGETPLSSA